MGLLEEWLMNVFELFEAVRRLWMKNIRLDFGTDSRLLPASICSLSVTEKEGVLGFI